MLSLPPTRRLSPDEKKLIWKFRFWLRSEKKALTKFLKCVDWSKPSEEKEAMALMYYLFYTWVLFWSTSAINGNPLILWMHSSCYLTNFKITPSFVPMLWRDYIKLLIACVLWVLRNSHLYGVRSYKITCSNLCRLCVMIKMRLLPISLSFWCCGQ